MTKKQRYTITAEEVWQSKKPRYNPYQTGHGPHNTNKKKYSRKEKHKTEYMNMREDCFNADD